MITGLFLAVSLVAQGAALEAFPGAEGAGACATGGRGGAVYVVTTLDDYHPGAGAREAILRNETAEEILPAQPAVPREPTIPGSLREAVEAEGPRIVVFRIAGTIALKAPLTITHPHITIAGQTAPGGGICLKNYGVSISNTHDVIVQHLRVRPGDASRRASDAINVGRAQNVIIDHCSTSWAMDEVLSVTGEGADKITVQWCFITESLHDSWHQKGPHGMGSLIRADGAVTFHHNLFAMHNARSPRPGTYGEPPGLHLHFCNNLIYNWGAVAGYSAEDPVTMNYVANYIKPGPAVKKNRRIAFNIGGEATQIYATRNVLFDDGEFFRRDWELIAGERPGNKLDEPFPAAPVATTSGEQAYVHVLHKAGATLPQRDAVDTRIVEHVRNLQGAIVNSPSDVGGWPEMASAEAPADKDRDGMPDDWEAAQGLDPEDPDDNVLDVDGDGYTNIEAYIFGIGD